MKRSAEGYISNNKVGVLLLPSKRQKPRFQIEAGLFLLFGEA